MLDSIKMIGSGRKEKIPQSLIRGVRSDVKKPLLMRLIFSIDEKKIKSDFIEIDGNLLKEYLWVGNSPGNIPQNRLTTDNLNYLINSKNEKRVTYNILQNIKEFFGKKPPQTVLELQTKLEKIEKVFFMNEKIKKKIQREIEKVTLQNTVLFTVCIEEKRKIKELAKMKGYQEFLKYVFLRPHKTIRSRCHVCGEEKKVLADPSFPSGSILKIYVTDKKGFMSGVAETDEAKVKTFSVCLECLSQLLAGENFIRSSLVDRINEFNIYLIPAGVKVERLEEISQCIREVFGAVKGFEGLQEFERKLQREWNKKLYEKTISENIHLDLIFGAPAQAKFVFQYYIQDVPILCLEELRHEITELERKTEGLLGNNNWYLGFQEIVRIFPLRRERGKIKILEWKAILESFSAILTKTPYPRDLLIKKAIQLAKIHRFGVYQPYNIKKPANPDVQMSEDLLKFNILLKLLIKIGCISMRSEKIEVKIEVPPEIEKWWEEMNYNEKQRGLFLLGYLIGKVGTEQWKKGDKKKAILNRINFDGMNYEKVIMLANSILKSLRDYRILSENEIIYASMKFLLDRTINEMQDPKENVFYILSGYAFSTHRAMISGGEK